MAHKLLYFIACADLPVLRECKGSFHQLIHHPAARVYQIRPPTVRFAIVRLCADSMLWNMGEDRECTCSAAYKVWVDEHTFKEVSHRELLSDSE